MIWDSPGSTGAEQWAGDVGREISGDEDMGNDTIGACTSEYPLLLL